MNNRSSNAEFHRLRRPRVWMAAALTMAVIVSGLVVGISTTASAKITVVTVPPWQCDAQLQLPALTSNYFPNDTFFAQPLFYLGGPNNTLTTLLAEGDTFVWGPGTNYGWKDLIAGLPGPDAGLDQFVDRNFTFSSLGMTHPNTEIALVWRTDSYESATNRNLPIESLNAAFVPSTDSYFCRTPTQQEQNQTNMATALLNESGANIDLPTNDPNEVNYGLGVGLEPLFGGDSLDCPGC